MKVKLLVALLISSWVVSAVLIYFLIDRSITLSYIEQSADVGSTCTRELEGLLGSEWKGMPESMVFEKLQAEATRHPDKHIVVKKEEGATIWFDQIPFNFEQGRLRSIGGT